MDRLRQLAERGTEVGGGFYGETGGAPAMPFRPPGQEVARQPPAEDNYYTAPKHEAPRRARAHFVDQIDNGQARLVDDEGNAHVEPAQPHWREGAMTDGSLPADTGGNALRALLAMGDDGHSPISLEEIGAALPKVPLAPGSPGPPIPPPADGMIGQKQKGPRKVTP